MASEVWSTTCLHSNLATLAIQLCNPEGKRPTSSSPIVLGGPTPLKYLRHVVRLQLGRTRNLHPWRIQISDPRGWNPLGLKEAVLAGLSELIPPGEPM